MQTYCSNYESLPTYCRLFLLQTDSKSFGQREETRGEEEDEGTEEGHHQKEGEMR